MAKSFDDNCNDGWLLTATVLSLKVDITDKPTTFEAKVFIGGSGRHRRGHVTESRA
jgi:hypothetical protein